MEDRLLNQGLISVVITTYQHAGTLAACLDSVLAQTYPSLQIIVVNDGSTDSTDDVVKPYLNQIQYITQANAGSNPARNRGFLEVKGEFVIFCDADVRMKPHMLESLLAALNAHPEASYAYSSFIFGWKVFGGVPFTDERMKTRNFVHTSALVRTKDFPGFDEVIKRLQDWDVWLTMLENGKRGVLVPELLFEVAVEGKSRIGSNWMPSFMYSIPWKTLGWMPAQVKKYEAARDIIAKKHGLS